MRWGHLIAGAIAAAAVAVESCAGGASFAYPVYRHLAQATYGGTRGCLLCHAGAGRTERNPYGMAWQDAGEDAAGFRAIEAGDADGDGVSNLSELRGDSNPGDRQSRPGSPGQAWQDAVPIAVPLEEVGLALPRATRIEVREPVLAPADVAAIERRVGRALTAEERTPTLFLGFRGKRETGQAIFVHVVRPEGRFVLLAALGGRKVKRLFLFRAGDDDSAPYQPLLRCLAGATRATLGALPRRCPRDARRRDTFQALVVALQVALETIETAEGRQP